MTSKRYFVIVAMIVLAAVGGLLLASRTWAGQPEGSPAAGQSNPAGNPASPNDPRWEYRILSAPLQQLSGVIVYDIKSGKSTPGPPTLEQRINELALQGFQVESFQTSLSVNGGTPGEGFSLTSVIVLMKRIKK